MTEEILFYYVISFLNKLCNNTLSEKYSYSDIFAPYSTVVETEVEEKEGGEDIFDIEGRNENNEEANIIKSEEKSDSDNINAKEKKSKMFEFIE